jgi:hypothetical protein
VRSCAFDLRDHFTALDAPQKQIGLDYKDFDVVSCAVTSDASVRRR